MTTSTSFAQMANNQSISLLSALRANTPPTKGQTTSRKFLTLSIFFLLSFFTTNAWGAEELVYTLTPADGTNNSYTGNCDIKIDGITWNLTGNSQMDPWRIGGKSLSGVDRALYSKTAIEKDISKIVISHGAANNITVNSVKLFVSTKENGTGTVISELSNSLFTANSTMTFTRPAGKSWANAYYKIVYNVTVSGSSNKFVEFQEAEFYAETASADPCTVTLKDDNSTLTQSTAGGSVTLPSRDGCVGYTFVGWTKTWSVAQTTWTTTAPTIIPTGSYTPTANESLYPVYTKTESGGSSIITFTPGIETGSTSVTKSGVTCTMSTMNNASYYQIYGNASGTFSVASGNITAISFTCTESGTNKYGPGNASADVGTYSYSESTGSWSGSASSITISSTAQVRMTTLSITCSGGSTTYYISVPDCGTPTPTPTLNVDPATLTFENTTTNTSTEKTFTLTGSDLTANASLQLSGINSGMFSLSSNSVTQSEGSINQTITVTYTPTVTGSHNATLTISSTGAESKTVTLSGTGVAPAPTYTITWKVNGEEYTEGGPTTSVVQGNAITKLPTAPAAPSGCSEKVFVGWSETNLGMELGQSAPTDLFTTAPTTLITEPKIYHAVFADVESGGVIPTLPTAIAYWGKQEIKENTGIPATSGTGTMTSNVSLSSNSNRTYQSTISKNATITLSGLNLTSYDDITLTFWARGSAKGDITITTNLSNEAISTVTLTGTEELYKINNIPNTATSITLTYGASSGSFFFGTVKLMETETTTYSFTKLTSENTNGWTGQDWNGYYLITNSQSELQALDGNAIGEKLYQSVTDNDGVIQSVISSAFLVSYNSTENGYSVKGVGENMYLGAGNNSVSVSSTAVYHTEIDYNALKHSANSSTTMLSWNTSASKFGFYNSIQTDPLLYKIMGGRYSNYVTLCDATKATITYDLNGGTEATCEQQTVTKGEAFTLCDQTPTKTGYNFAGWTDGVNTYDAGASTSVTDNTKFYAKWTAKTITITWNQNYTGCPEPIEMQYVYDSDENTMPEEPVREGYQFVGWFTGVADGIEITEIGEENRPTDNVTYYAHWNELYSVTFMVSGQIYVVQEDKYINGDAIELPAEPSAANYACDGYVFDGWSALEKPTEDATKPELITASTIIDADREFHAVWAKSSTGVIQTDFVKVTAEKDDWTGDYVIVDEDVKKAIGNAYQNTNTLKAIDVTITDNKVVSPSNYIIWQIRKHGENYTMYNASANQYAYIAKANSEGAGLSATTTNTTQDIQIIFNNGTAKVSGVDIYRCFSYYGSKTEWRTYATGSYNTGALFYRPVASYTYTTHPNCGPTIVAKDDMWVTSANGQSVKINVPIAVKSFTNTATITGTSTNENFVVAPLENVTNGINDVVEVIYTPTTADTREETTITLTAKNGEEILTTTTFTLNGRSLPDEFVIVAQYNDKWLAVPANMQSGADQYNGIEVTPDNALTQIPAAPSTTIYSLRGVADSRYEEAGTCVRLVGNGNKCLWGNAATTNTTIQNWTTLASTNGSNYEWLLTTSDGELYTIANPAHPDYNQGRILSNLGSKYGLYKETTKFYILPVGCSSLPGNIQVTARRVDATFSWEGNASSMQIDVYTNEDMTEGHISNTATASPYYMTGLSESTQYWFEMTPNGTDKACAYTGSFKTTGPTIDVVEWQENAAVIFVDKDEELNPLVIIDGEVEHGVGTGSQATELFFSKYFEAHAENKLLAIYNGTANTIDLTGYVIRQENAELNLALYGKTKGKIAPNEEIILVYFDATYSAESCAKQQDNYETWNVLNDKSVLAFSGRGSIGLYKNDVLIDVIGSTFPSGELTKIGKSDKCGTGSDVRLHVDELSVNDQSSFFCSNGDNIKTPEVENDYAISTNRCLLIRKNSVTSGANAVASNKADDDDTCGDLSTTFTTLCSEWSGFRIGGGKSSDEEIREATCDGLGYVGGFDYNQYYKEYSNIDNDTYLESYTHDDATKEYTIPIDNLAQYSCLNLRFQLKQGDQVLTEEPVQVPIIVSGEKATNDAIFNAIVKTDGDLPVYDQSIERCKTCNVVVLSGATLTKAADGATNDVAEVYNMKVYPGGQVVVPASTNYTINSLAFRRQEDEVSMANIQGTLNVKHANGVYLDVRIDPSNWHYMTLPYDCRVGDVTFADGTPAVVNTDYLLGWYDGAYRAEHKTGGWTYITDNDYILKKGLGYIVALPGDGKVRREIRFPMANDVIAADLESKTVSGLYAYGGDKTDAELRPNHKGWNMIGSPYLYTYTTDIVKEPLQMGTLEHSPVNPWDGTWVRTGDARYIVEPIDNGWSGYRQETISNLKPFTSYFIQVGGVKNGEEYTTVTPETEQQIVFAANSVARNASAPRKVAEAEVMDNHPVWYGVEMIAPNNEKDNTTLLISDDFTDGYDMMDDLVKMRGDYYQYYNFPVLASRNNEGEMAFNALPDSSAAKIGVPLNYYAATAGTYTIATDGRFDLEEVKAAMLYDATTAQYTNLLTDNYSFTTNKGNNTNRFTLFVTVERKKVPNITTGMDNLLANGQLSLIAIERTLVLSGLTENADIYVYDMNGKLITGTHTAGDNGVWRTIVPATGVYFVRVNSANNQQTLRTIVK